MKVWYDGIFGAQHTHQSEINEALKLDYILKIAAAYFNEIAMQDYAVAGGCSSWTKSNHSLYIYAWYAAFQVQCNSPKKDGLQILDFTLKSFKFTEWKHYFKFFLLVNGDLNTHTKNIIS